MPFSQLPFEVYDGKDGSSTWQDGPLDFIESADKILDSLGSISNDIQTLAESGVCLGRDSISFGIKDQKIRLYLFDLDDMKIDNFSSKEDLAYAYSCMVIEMLDNLFSLKKARVLEQNGYDFRRKYEIAEELAGLVLERINSKKT